jgi:4-hydroxysphinganine ceramide fatty acyl 2-hydroxylase
MKDFKIDNRGSGQLFQNKFLEYLTRTNFIFPVILFFVIAIVVFIYGLLVEDTHAVGIIYLFPLGIITFTLVEYLIHRFLFHFNAETEKEQQFQYTIHGVHHEFPKDKDRLVMPPLISFILAIFFFVLFKVILDDGVYVFYPGFVAGYSIYLLIHYALHRLHPPKNFLKYFWKHHSLHHYKNVNGYYSVSFPPWDYIFRTMPANAAKDKTAENKLPDSM